jgi:hypothetical protein
MNAMPAQIGRFSLSKAPQFTYVGTVNGNVQGDVITYTISNGARLVFAVWFITDINSAKIQYSTEISNLAVPAIPVEIGDEAFIAPTNKGRDDGLAFNPGVWGEMMYRNILIRLQPTKTLTDQTSTTQDELVQLLTAAFNAINSATN